MYRINDIAFDEYKVMSVELELDSCDLIRAQSTAAALAKLTNLKVEINPGLRETNGGLWEGKTLTEEEINRAGYEGEKGYHGTPSGIDNTAATYGGVLRFQRTDGTNSDKVRQRLLCGISTKALIFSEFLSGDPIFVTKKLKTPVEVVYASTGITASTSKVVADVRAKKEADEAWFGALIGKYQELVIKGEKALDDADWNTLGQLLNENHSLCQELTVSCKELDTLVDAARAAGAIGAKMSGTGRGGLMLALTPGKESQDAVAEALLKAGAAQVWKTRLA